MDDAARKLGVDPIDIRLKNAKEPVRSPPWAWSWKHLHGGLLAAGAEAFGWYEKRAQPKKDEGPIKRGYGLATMSHCTGAAPCTWSTQRHGQVQRGRLRGSDRAPGAGRPAYLGRSPRYVLKSGIRRGRPYRHRRHRRDPLRVRLPDASRSTYAIGGATLRAARQAKRARCWLALLRCVGSAGRPTRSKGPRWWWSGPAGQDGDGGQVCYDSIYALEGAPPTSPASSL